MSSYSEGQTHQLMNALEAKGFTPDHVMKLGQYKRLGDIRLVLDGQAEIVVKAEAPPDTIIRVDRSIRPVYPSWVNKVMHPELEGTGPTVYDLATAVSLWLHDDQKVGITTGKMIYGHLLEEHGMLGSCLSLRDAEEIRKKSAAVYREIFGNNTVYFWKSVVESRCGRFRSGLGVPCLCVSGGVVVLVWRLLGLVWNDRSPAARFAK
ncbi:MAG: hypothetical protein V1778_03040 [bacterium]